MRDKPTDHPIFSDPNWFLHGFDPDQCLFTFIKTNRAKLKSAVFHDGRSRISLDDEIVAIPLQEALEWQNHLDFPPAPHRVIAHISFCGSTVLARTLDIDGKVMTYREPQVFIDLANTMAMRHPVFVESHRWTMITRFALGQFQREWPSKEVPVLKLSNWANNLLSDWAQLSESLRLVIVHMDLESYIFANLRGGRERLKFSLNLLNHLTIPGGKHRSVVEQIDASSADPFDQVLRLLATCYDLQRVLLQNATEKMRKSQAIRWITKNEIVDTPIASVSQTAQLLELELDREEIVKSIATRPISHAKSQSRDRFSLAAETAANDKISRQDGDQIVATLNWHHHTFQGQDI